MADEIEQVEVADAHSTPGTSSDEPMHSLAGSCWCQPVVDYEDPISGARVYLHRRTLDSPAYEPIPTAEIA